MMRKMMTMALLIGLLAMPAWAQVCGDDDDTTPLGMGPAGVALAPLGQPASPTTQPGKCFMLRLPGGAQGGWIPLPGQFKPEMIKASYLGVSANPLTDATLRAQLSLSDGVGLGVSYIDPEGPAKKAGIQEHDILWRLNDQLLVNMEQLAVLVRTFESGEEVTLTVIRQAKPQRIAVRLSEKEQPKFIAPPCGPMPCMPNMPRIGPGPGRGTLPPGGLRNWVQPGGPGGCGVGVNPFLPPQFQVPVNGQVRGFGGEMAGEGQLQVTDGEHDITVRQSSDGSRTLTAKDKKGSVLFDGPINTPEERAKVPANLLKMVDEVKMKVRGMQAPVGPGCGAGPAGPGGPAGPPPPPAK